VTSADVPTILALIGGVYAEYGCKLDAENEERHLLDPGGYFRSRRGEFWVVEDDTGVFATVGVLIHPDAAELKTLYVRASHRGRGWGARLVELTIDYARRAGRRRMILWSDTRFTRAHALYRRLGFAQEGVRELRDSNRSVEYGFHRELDAGEQPAPGRSAMRRAGGDP
jgi:GNAT superfamily N-acetyltransferase